MSRCIRTSNPEGHNGSPAGRAYLTIYTQVSIAPSIAPTLVSNPKDRETPIVPHSNHCHEKRGTGPCWLNQSIPTRIRVTAKGKPGTLLWYPCLQNSFNRCSNIDVMAHLGLWGVFHFRDRMLSDITLSVRLSSPRSLTPKSMRRVPTPHPAINRSGESLRWVNRPERCRLRR